MGMKTVHGIGAVSTVQCLTLDLGEKKSQGWIGERRSPDLW